MTPRATPDSLDIVELQMALEASLDRQLTETEIRDLTDRLRALVAHDPDCLREDDLQSLVHELNGGHELEGGDDDDTPGVPVRKPDPRDPRPRRGRAAARPESD